MNETLIKELEKVFTIDGRGRPKKVKLLLDLITIYGMDVVMPEIKKIGERKVF